MPNVTSVGLSGNQDIDGLLLGMKWSVNSFSYSFPTSGSLYESGYGSGEQFNNFRPLDAAQKAAVREIFEMFSAVANVGFTETSETSTQHADLRYAMSDDAGTAYAYIPGNYPEAGDSWYDPSGAFENPVKGSYAYFSFIHETGHALGLKHGQEAEPPFPAMTFAHNSGEYSVMTYNSYAGDRTAYYDNEEWSFPQSLMMYDIAALQYLYGANYGTESGNTVYTWSPTTGEEFINGAGQGAPGANRIFMTVWDGGGVDTYDFSNYGTGVQVDLRPGMWTVTSPNQLAALDRDGSPLAVGNIANALLHNGDPRSLIENATGGVGNDVLTGNQTTNQLKGGPGNDEIRGLEANDTLFGGVGDDLIYGNQGYDLISAVGAIGSDTVFGGKDADKIDYSGALADALIYGNKDADVVHAGSGSDHLYGGQGDDVLHAGAGNDFLYGNKGADRLYGELGADTFVFGGTNGLSEATADVIFDFEIGIDRIDVAGSVSAQTYAEATAATFSAAATAAGSLLASGDLLVLVGGGAGGEAWLFVDENGDHAADYAVELAGLGGSLAAIDYLSFV